MASAALYKKKPDVLLDNVAKLEELLRKTSKEENPILNYSRFMRSENKVEKF